MVMSTEREARIRRRGGRMVVAAAPLLLAAVVSSCSVLGERAPEIQQLALAYPAPAATAAGPVATSVKVQRFVGVAPFDGTTMYVSSDPYTMDSFNYSRWIASPGVMVCDLLYRDLLHSGSFAAVHPHLSGEDARFELEGSVETFLSVEGPEGRHARLTVNITLVDASEHDSARRSVLQRTFSSSAAVDDASAQSLAAGMSVAMEGLSGQVIRAMREAVRSRVGEAGRGSRPGG